MRGPLRRMHCSGCGRVILAPLHVHPDAGFRRCDACAYGPGVRLAIAERVAMASDGAGLDEFEAAENARDTRIGL